MSSLVSKLRPQNQRDSVILRNVLASFAIKGSSLIVTLLTMPAYIRFFENQEVLGVWFTIITTLSWILNFDLGLGNGLRNHLVGALDDPSSNKARSLITSTYISIFALVLLIGAACVVAVPLVDWNKFFNISAAQINSEAFLSAVGFVILGILVQLFLRTITSILFALQKAALPSLISLLTSVLMLAAVLLLEPGTSEHNVVVLAQVYALAANIPLVIATFLVFGISLRHCLPSLSSFQFVYAKEVLRLGGAFFALQMLFMLFANTNPFLISRLTGPEDVVLFQIYSKPFTTLSSLFILALTPIWSAVTEAASRSDFGWINQLFKRLSKLALITSIGLLAFVPLLQIFVNVWLGADSISIYTPYALAFAASASVFAWNGALSSIANGAGMLRVQVVMLLIGVSIKFVLAVVLTEATGSWIWVVVSDVVGLLPYIIVQSIALKHYSMR